MLNLDFELQPETEQPKSGINEESLMLQQESLKKIWDHPGEDIYLIKKKVENLVPEVYI